MGVANAKVSNVPNHRGDGYLCQTQALMKEPEDAYVFSRKREFLLRFPKGGIANVRVILVLFAAGEADFSAVQTHILRSPGE